MPCAGNDDELADWAAFQTATASAWKRGWAKGTLKEWAHDLLQKVLFKVHAILCPETQILSITMCDVLFD